MYYSLSRYSIFFLMFTLHIGCSSDESKSTATAGKDSSVASSKGSADHSGWWCAEHGVPEEVCGLCDSKVGAEMKKKGDWCKEHDCPESQCFVCNPQFEAKFAAQYEAKYGTKPPSR